MKIFGDYHTHTVYSHGRGRVEDNVRAAVEKGLSEIAITDHGPGSLFGVGVGNERILLEIKEEVERCRREYRGIRILTGVEANIVSYDGRLDVSRSILDRLDIVLIGFHSWVRCFDLLTTLKMNFGRFLTSLSGRLSKTALEANTASILRCIEMYDVDIVSHPGLKMAVDVRRLAEACSAAGTVLEINAYHGSLDKDLIATAKRSGAKFCINSDAHSPGEVGEVKEGIGVALSAGLNEGDIINAEFE